MAFFMPSRISFSIWSFQILYAGYVIVGLAYLPPFHWGSVTDHRMGAMIAMSAAVLWLGRRHWAHVLACVVRRPVTEEDGRDRKAGRMFLLGCAGLWAWLWWAGVQPLWAAFFTAYGFMICLTISRIVAETGMPFIRMQFDYGISLVHLAPLSWLSLPVLYFARIVAMLFQVASRTSCTTVTTHVMALDRDTPPGRQWRTAALLLLVLALGVLVCGASHLRANYHHSMTLDGNTRPLNPYGQWLLSHPHRDITNFAHGRLPEPGYNKIGHIGFGAALALLLQWACMAMPRWPLHPIGLLMVYSFYANNAWVSVLVGWLAKVLILRYGGSRLYRAAHPLFLGVIVGEVFGAAFWALDPAVRVALGVPYQVVQIQPY
jgi:hypothetical protein